jgi:RNA polymerase sigma factor (sigma-70 family)
MSTLPSHLSGPETFAGLLEAARHGCGESRGRLLCGHRAYLYSIIAAYDGGHGPHDSWLDLVQETYLHALQRFDAFRGASEAELRSWLRTILLHLVADYRVQRAHRPGQIPLDQQEPAETTSPIGLAAEHDDEVRLRCAFLQLPTEQQQVLQLRGWEK